jgi:hypothetical protein
MKIYSVAGFFPEAKAHCAEQVCTAKADSLELAASRGLKELRKRAGIKGKQITTVKLTIRLIGEAPKDQDSDPRQDQKQPALI